MILLIFILCFGFLIMAHEFGHFIVAKKNGVKVEEFGIGFPPKLFGKKIGETVYSINAIPIGGFVRIFGEEGEASDNSRSFAAKSIWQKISILVAGVGANLLVAGLIFSFLFTIGFPLDVSNEVLPAGKKAEIVITSIEKNSPAQVAGLKVGDVVLKVRNAKGQEFIPERITDFQKIVSENEIPDLNLIIKRGGETLNLQATPRVNHAQNVGPLGVSLMELVYYRYPLFRAVGEGFKHVVILSKEMVFGLIQAMKDWFVQKVTPQVTGPIGIASLSIQMAHIGWRYFFNFLAFLSTNLAIVNILPLPALDGGRVVLAIIEKLRKKSLPLKVVEAINGIGLLLLLLLSLLIALKDVAHLHLLSFLIK
ncbi:MAG TPA: RIP metalloprotease RseP [Candidatus Paceibacterota bacterium]|nr:RIP metalloprotease RseP [Candidatus Paceibacterota bacterium]